MRAIPVVRNPGSTPQPFVRLTSDVSLIQRVVQAVGDGEIIERASYVYGSTSR